MSRSAIGRQRAVLAPVPQGTSLLALLARYLRRAVTFAVLGLALFALWAIVSPVLPDRFAFAPRTETVPAQPAEPAPPPARPAGVPARIPAWAWSLQAWLSAAPPDRGARPQAAPRHVPAWFWDWRRWRLAVESHG